MLVIVTIISSITALVSDNVWFAFDILFLWTMVSIRRFLPPLYHVFTRFVCCFARNNINPFFAPIGLLETITHFQSKTVFFFQLIAVRFWLLFSVYVFLRALLTVLIAWNYKKFAIFQFSEKTKFEVDTTSIILSYIYHFGSVNKKLFRYC